MELVRYGVTVRVGAKDPCTAKDCDRPRAGQLVWHDDKAGSLHAEDVCAWHLFRLRGLRCLTFPLGKMPPLRAIGEAYQREAQRRQSYQPYFNYSSGTGSYQNIFVRFR